jgi:predicted tellurium resistance membrane protein TerC
MPRAIAIRLAILVAILVWPAFFSWLSEFDQEHGLIWLLLQQVYYLPFSWVGPPLFTPDSDIGVLVQPTGRAFAVFFYVLWFYVIIRIIDRRKLASLYGKSKSDAIRD